MKWCHSYTHTHTHASVFETHSDIRMNGQGERVIAPTHTVVTRPSDGGYQANIVLITNRFVLLSYGDCDEMSVRAHKQRVVIQHGLYHERRRFLQRHDRLWTRRQNRSDLDRRRILHEFGSVCRALRRSDRHNVITSVGHRKRHYLLNVLLRW